jgi:cytochrome P450
LPVVGRLPDYVRDPLALFTGVARRYGDVASLPLGRMSMWLLSHPDDIERVHVHSVRDFDKGYGSDDPFLGSGLVNSEGEFWRQQRRMIQPAFHQRRIQAYAEVMVRRGRQLTDRWSPGAVVDVHAEMMEVTLAIISETMFSADVTRDSGAVAMALDMALNAASGAGESGILPAWVPTPARRRTRVAVAALDEVILGIIAARRARDVADASGGTSGEVDLLGMLLAARDAEGSGMSDRQLRDEAMTIFPAGHETTSNALTFAFLLMSRHPDVRRAMAEEIQGVLGDDDLVPDHVARLPYTTAVLKESMRLYPPVWVVARRARADTEVGGYRVPAGTDLAMSQWVVHRDARFYDEPDRFRPERWLGGTWRTGTRATPTSRSGAVLGSASATPLP